MKKDINIIKELLHREVTPHLPFYSNFIHITDLRPKMLKHNMKK